MAKWAMGTRRAPIPSLVTGHSTTNSPAEKASAFRSKYFSTQPSAALPPTYSFVGACPMRDHPILMEELDHALNLTSNSSAPGITGVGYQALKSLHAAHSVPLLALYNECLNAGHHPRPWKDAKVVMLCKLNKKDPTALNAYRPITLEETMGKLLEKIIANCIQFIANELGALPPSQFGTRQKSGVLDATSDLVNEIESAWAKHHVTTALAVDVAGFFPSVQHPRLLAVLTELGFPPLIVSWVLSFVSDHRVALSFDGFTDTLTPIPNMGVPQGSPISPILSALFATSLLTSLQVSDPLVFVRAYVDDHLLTTSSSSIATNVVHLEQAYVSFSAACHALGLSLDDDKTELIHWTRRLALREDSLIHPIHLPRQGLQPLRIVPSQPLCWLGIFFDVQLLFTVHVQHMCFKAMSSLRALELLGNTLRGLDPLHLRRLYIGCILPVLLWGSPLWFTGIRQKSKCDKMTLVQSAACHRILGSWRMSPRGPSEVLASILPIPLRLERTKSHAAIRYLTTTHTLLPIRTTRKGTITTSFVNRVPPGCERVPRYTRPPWIALPALRHVSIDSAIDHSQEARDALIQSHHGLIDQLKNVPSHLLIYTDGSHKGTSPSSFSGGAAGVWFYRGENVLTRKTHLGSSVHATDCELAALADAAWLLAYSYDLHPVITQVEIYTDCEVALTLLADPRPAPGVNVALLIRKCLKIATKRFPHVFFHLHWVPGHSDVEGNEFADVLTSGIADNPPPPPQTLPRFRPLSASFAKLPPLRRFQNGNPTGPTPVANSKGLPTPIPWALP